MKMVKSLLLGSAAGLVAVTAGQAADLPVKAKPVEYVKICSLYGAGFYYMPGTDMCIKVGGWMRAEVTVGTGNGSLSAVPYNGTTNTNATNNFITRSRGYVTVDAREQTAYGTARAYLDVGISNSNVGLDSATNTFSSNRAFLQWAGFTAGLTQSFYDFYSAPAVLYRAGYMPIEDTGDGGWWLWAYTAQLGNGMSATISAEQRRMLGIVDQDALGTAATTIGTGAVGGVSSGGSPIFGALTLPSGYGGMQAPDVVANIRVDQTWGSAQLMGALHEVNPLYYGTTPVTGHPSDTWGWVVGAGLRLNFPMIAQGDYFQGEVNYTQGALRYLDDVGANNFDFITGNTLGYGVQTDCVFGGTSSATTAPANGTGCNLTTAWSINASYEHYWTPQWHQSLVGAYYAVSYDTQANAMLCVAGGDGAGVGTAAVAAAGCNNNFSFWAIGSRLQWDVTKTFYLGVEALYTQLDTATTSTGTPLGYGPGASTAAAPNTTPMTLANQSGWSFTARMHKDFLP